MTNTIYIVEFITRAHSSGYENKTRRLFKNIENASKYMMDIFQEYGIEEDHEDLFVDEEMAEQAPKPTMELAAQLFSPDALNAFLNKCKLDDTIYGPYSEFCCLVPFEILFAAEDVA